MKNLNTNALENLKLDLENHVLIVTMNRPKALNALNNQTLDELQMVFDYVSKENDIYGVIITGEGRGFVAGADIVQMQPYRSDQGRDCLVRLVQAWQRKLFTQASTLMHRQPCVTVW